MMKSILLGCALALVSTATHSACLYGSAVNSDGSKIDGSAKVSTSWNGKQAFPRNGKYQLCLGSNPKASITVYLDGRKYTQIHVNGDTRLDLRR